MLNLLVKMRLLILRKMLSLFLLILGKFDFLKEEFPNLKIMYFPRGKVSSSNIKKEIGKLYSKKESSDNTTK